ncbi:MAG: alpha/beta hydrolase, partial [Jatrophihabitantaceae bacterium]
PDGTYTNIRDANAVISCNDSPILAPVPDSRILATARQWARQYPLFGADAAGALLACRGWQPDRTPVPPPSAATPTTVLVVGNLHDPATPYIGAEHLTRGLGHARLLTWNGEGHTSFLSGSRCVDRYVSAFLTSGSLPPDHTVCPR